MRLAFPGGVAFDLRRMRLVFAGAAALVVLLQHLLEPAAAIAGSDPDQPRRVLLLCAEQRLIPAVVQVDASLRATLSADAGMPVIFHREYRNLPPVRDDAYGRQMRALLGLKYRGLYLRKPFREDALIGGIHETLGQTSGGRA